MAGAFFTLVFGNYSAVKRCGTSAPPPARPIKPMWRATGEPARPCVVDIVAFMRVASPLNHPAHSGVNNPSHRPLGQRRERNTLQECPGDSVSVMLPTATTVAPLHDGMRMCCDRLCLKGGRNDRRDNGVFFLYISIERERERERDW